jgi:hypothetical protein
MTSNRPEPPRTRRVFQIAACWRVDAARENVLPWPVDHVLAIGRAKAIPTASDERFHGGRRRSRQRVHLRDLDDQHTRYVEG